ncbi:hypothetical protein [Psychromonas aquimarina]|uniref:hypothetical protein n=1 Tax=Psychromonas aquimarina TaxID=444919 RepID=UPI00048FD0F9|nr:hypothetical protein [Psychromonas aquimarina]
MPSLILSRCRAYRRLLSCVLIASVLSFSLGAFIYFFDLNDYRGLISRQINRATGYQVSFAALDSRLLSESRISFSGLSLAADNRELVYIDNVEININKLSLWNRELELGLVELTGVNIRGDVSAFTKLGAENTSSRQSASNIQAPQQIPWKQFKIQKLSVKDLNVDITQAEQLLVVDGAALSSKELVLIENQQLAAAFFKGNLKLAFKELSAQHSNSEKLRLSGFNLDFFFTLQTMQAGLDIKADKLDISLNGQQAAAAHNTQLVMELNKDKLSIKSLSTELFSGELQLQADILLSMRLSAKPALAVKTLTVHDLAVTDMDLIIPPLAERPIETVSNTENNKQPLPIENLFVKQMLLTNINISSNNQQFPLVVKNFNSRVSNFTLLHNHQVKTLPEEARRAGSFSVQFAYLQWASAVIEQFEVSGRLSKNDQAVLLIKQLLKTDAVSQ